MLRDSRVGLRETGLHVFVFLLPHILSESAACHCVCVCVCVTARACVAVSGVCLCARTSGFGCVMLSPKLAHTEPRHLPVFVTLL